MGARCWALLLAAVALGARAGADDLVLRIMTYNIFYGGQNHEPVLNRHHEWLRVIESRDPDVLVVVEANGWLPTEQNLIAAYVDSLNQAFPLEPPYRGCVGDANSAFNVALITRLPILQFDQYRVVQVQREICTLQHVFVHAALAAEGERIHIVGVHFRPNYNERQQRELEARALLTILQGLPAGEKVWVMGDFNSYSPVDVQPGSPTPPLYQLGAPSPELYGWEPVGYLLERGYRDAFRSQHPLLRGYTKDTRSFLPATVGPFMRIDFLLDSPGYVWSPVSSEVVTDGLADSGSDHYAVCAVFRRPGWAAAGEDARATTVPSGPVGPNPLIVPGALRYHLARPGDVTLELFAVDGRRIASLEQGWRPAGLHEARWDGCDRAGAPIVPGMYYVRIAGVGGAGSGRALLVRRP